MVSLCTLNIIIKQLEGMVPWLIRRTGFFFFLLSTTYTLGDKICRLGRFDQDKTQSPAVCCLEVDIGLVTGYVKALDRAVGGARV